MDNSQEWRRKRQIGRWLISTTHLRLPVFDNDFSFRITIKLIVKGLHGNNKQFTVATIGSNEMKLARRSVFKIARNFMHDTYQLHNKVRLTQDETD